MPLPRPAAGTGRWWVIGTIGIGIGIALAVWLGLANSVGAVTWDVTAYKVESDASVRLGFDVHRPSGTAVICHVVALDTHFGTVGSLDVLVAATQAASVHQDVTIRTASRAVTGDVKSCEKA
ncbi:MAG: DUF4307 domain-containing protein [Nostocoides sp.]